MVTVFARLHHARCHDRAHVGEKPQHKADDGADASHLRALRLGALPHEEQDEANEGEEEAKDAPADAAAVVDRWRTVVCLLLVSRLLPLLLAGSEAGSTSG